ncbi:MAG: SMC-Scp complex subunit ScpB [Calditrichia bacterium]
MSSNKNEKAEKPATKENAVEVEAKSPKNGEAKSTVKVNTLTDKEMQAIVEAILFASEEPLNSARIREVAPELSDANMNKIIRSLNKTYEKSSRPFHIDNVAGGYLMYTRPEYAEYVERLYARRQANRLSAKALETLAIIAYKQPITKNEMEEIRGVNVDGVVKTLLLRNLVTISGTAESIGNPFLYKTTKQFLEYFGLKNLKELPRLKELDEVIEADPDLKEQVGEEILKEIVPSTLGFDIAQLKDDFTSTQKASAEAAEAKAKEADGEVQQTDSTENAEETTEEVESKESARNSEEAFKKDISAEDSAEENTEKTEEKTETVGNEPKPSDKEEQEEPDIESSKEEKKTADEENKDDSAADADKQSANSPEKL